MKSIHRQVLGSSLFCVSFVLLAVGAAIYLWVRAATLSQIDDSLKLVSNAIETQIEITEHGLKWEGEVDSERSTARAAGNFEFVVVDRLGRQLIQSNQTQAVEEKFLSSRQVGFETILSAQKKALRTYSTIFSPRWEDDAQPHNQQTELKDLRLIAIRSLADWQALQNRLLWSVGTALTLGLAAVAGMLTWSVRQGLRPLDRVSREIESCDAGKLQLQIEPDDMPLELGSVVIRMKKLFERIRLSNQREQAFSANVAHELRNPLAGINSTIEVALSNARAPDEYREVLAECLMASRGLTKLVDQLLTIASLEGDRKLPVTSLCLSELVSRLVVEVEQSLSQPSCRINKIIEEGLVIHSNEESLVVVLRNLLGNAFEYCNAGGWIDVVCKRSLDCDSSGDYGVSIHIANSGCQIPSTDAEVVCDRFWRGDSARTDIGKHHGLGLALSKQLCLAVGATLRVSIENGEFHVDLSLPNRDSVGDSD